MSKSSGKWKRKKRKVNPILKYLRGIGLASLLLGGAGLVSGLSFMWWVIFEDAFGMTTHFEDVNLPTGKREADPISTGCIGRRI